MTLVEALEQGGERERLTPSRIEPAFILPERNELRFAPPDQETACGAFLAHRIARHPRDLRAHVQRIGLHLAEANAEGGYGALVDLFVALGPKGKGLRERMLDTASRLLDHEQYRALLRKLEDGLQAADPMPTARHSMLSKGRRGSRILVERLSTRATRRLDPLDEARGHLEYGQVQEARQLLEEALLEEPLRVELHQELLEIYRATRDLDNFSATWAMLDADENPAAEAWAAAAEALTTRE